MMNEFCAHALRKRQAWKPSCATTKSFPRPLRGQRPWYLGLPARPAKFPPNSARWRNLPRRHFMETNMAKMQRDKGARCEREIVTLHKAIGIKAERVPLSGATRYQGNSADIDVYAFGDDAAPLVCEVKARAKGEGFATITRWLGDNDALFLRQNNAKPFAVVPWRTWERLLKARPVCVTGGDSE